jgi:DnaK suppressor protein
MPKSSKSTPPPTRATVKGRAVTTKATPSGRETVPGAKKATSSVAAKRPVAKAAPAAKPVKKAVAAKTDAGHDKFLQEQRALLLEERESSERQAESLKAEAEQLAEDMEPGDTQFDEESGEGATLNVERERDLALSAQARAAVDEIDRALAKLDTGRYGICEQCGQPIPKARLKAVPYATLCVACKSGGLSRR